MYTTIQIGPGITLRCIRDTRFKQGTLSLQFLRPMCREEAGTNALIPAVLLRGCQGYPNLKNITEALDDLYGASVGTVVRRVGDYQTTGFYCGFVEDRFALPGDRILEPMVALLGKLLREPVIREDGFCPEYVESEKKNLIAAIESQRADKRAYAAAKLLRCMGQEDSFGVPRLGQIGQIRQLDEKNTFAHYQRILRESPVELFYVGSLPACQIAQLLTPLFAGVERVPVQLGDHKPFQAGPQVRETETMDVAQGKLAMGFVTPITQYDERFAAMQLCNSIFGGGMTNKIFNRIREELSLCYEISSAYYGSKGILTVHAGIDFDREAPVCREVLAQLEACQNGGITQQELDSAKEYLLSGLRAVTDTPGAMENYFSTCAISGIRRTPQSHSEAIRAATLADVTAAARTLQLHSSFFLKGEDHA